MNALEMLIAWAGSNKEKSFYLEGGSLLYKVSITFGDYTYSREMTNETVRNCNGDILRAVVSELIFLISMNRGQ